MKDTFTAPYRPQSNDLCERMNQMIENIIKRTVKDEYLAQVTRFCHDGLLRHLTNIDRVHTQYVGDREGN